VKEYICELCKKPIKKSDIRMTFNIRIDDRKTEEADMHAHCYYEFMEFARKNLIEDEKI